MIPHDVSIKKELFQAAHSVHMAGHRDGLETVTRLRRLAWWPRLHAWVSEEVKKCWACARSKHRTAQLAGHVKAIPLPSAPFAHVHIDAVAGLPAVTGLDQCWIVVDRLTRFVFFVPASAQDSAHEVARRLFDAVFSLVGLPTRITSDGEPRINGVFFTSLYRLAGITHNVSVPHRPQANGLAERMVRTLRGFLRTCASATKEDWPSRIRDAQFVCNASATSAHGFSPARLLFGIEPRGPLHLLLPSYTDDASDCADWLRNRAHHQEQAAEQSLAQQQRMLERINASRRRPQRFRVGD